ncbi:ABC transporter substrate-binding protein [Ruminococcus sp. AM27-16]|nr:ABC transporter substrate-binding protein [Ruminococcus sp. AM36-17]RHU01947.1 ABC transporter substrate-binding protein [Ruminococcus sp. AM27-16]
MIFKFLNKERMLSKMKRKLMICAMALCICAGLAGNTGAVSVWASEGSSSDAVRIGVLKGPTAMGMAQLLDEDGYDFTIAASPDEIVPMVVQDKLDIAAVPANLAATLYQKTDKDVSVLAVNTLGVLYIVENGDSVKSVEDLKGKTIYASGKGATPEYALNSVLKANGIDPEKDVTVEYKSEHAEVVSALVQDQTAVGLLPQPFVTTALMKNDKLKVALNLNKLWEDSMDDGSKLVTGVVIANNEFVQDHADKVNDFMDAYKESVDFVNSDTEAAAQIIGDHDIIAKEVAQKAIPDCSIVFIEGDEMKTMLSGYLATLDDQNPEIIGGQLPDDAFYYKR